MTRWAAAKIILVALSLVFPRVVDAGELELALERVANQLAERLPPDVQRPLPVIVYSFDGVDTGAGALMAEKLAGALNRLNRSFVVVERRRERLDDARREILFGTSEETDDKTAPEAGKWKGAKAIIYGKSEVSVKVEKLTVWVNKIETAEGYLAMASEEVRLTRPASYGGLRSVVLPGWGQWACGQRGVGAAFMLSTVGMGAGVLYVQGKAGDAHDQAVLAGAAADRDRFLAEEGDWKNRRNLLLAGLGATWVSNILHAAWLSSRTPIYAGMLPGERPSIALTLRF